MKRFLKIFIFLEVILFAYIFNTSIYNIYEKNNIAAKNLKGYVLEETSPGVLDSFYTIFTKEYSHNKLELINNTLTSTDKSVYDLYCFSLNSFTQNSLYLLLSYCNIMSCRRKIFQIVLVYSIQIYQTMQSKRQHLDCPSR